MNCTIACPQCRKQFSVPDWVIGRRVKCKSCGEPFEAPQPEEADALPDLAALEALEPPAATPPPIDAPRRPPAVPAFSTASAVSGPLLAPLPLSRTRRGRTAGPLDDLVHDKLPLALILIGYVLPIVLVLVMIIHFALGGILVFELMLSILAFVGITVPLTVVGLRIAAHVMDFELVESPGFRIVAAFAGSWIVLFVYCAVNPLPGLASSPAALILRDTAWLMEGLLLSCSASFVLMKLFFFLRAGEAVVAWIIASIAWLVGNIASLLMVMLALWIVKMVYNPVTSAPQATDAPSAQTPAPPPHDVEKETASLKNLEQIYQYLTQYYKSTGKYPDALEALVASQGMPSDALHSPFGSGAATDYAYVPYPVPGEPAGSDWVLVYDQAESSRENGAMMLRANGEIKFLDSNVLQYTLSEGQKSAQAENDRLKAAQAAANAALPPPIAPPPSAGPAATSDKPIDPNDEPILPTHAWHADPDPPAEQPRISQRLRHVFPVAGTFYFPPQPSNFMLLSRHDPTNKQPDRAPDELWNLKTLLKVSQFACIPVSGGAVLSADGKLFAIRSLGGQDLATEYQVYATANGKLVQTFGGPSMVGAGMPTPIGFVGDDQLVTLADAFDTWDIKQQKAVCHFGDPTKIDASTLVAISPTGKLLATLCGGETLCLYATQTGKLLGQTPIPDRSQRKSETAGTLRSLAFSPDGQELALFLNGRHIFVWTISDGALAARFDLTKPIDAPPAKADGAIDSMVWTPDSQGWLLGGDRIIDRDTGLGVYKVPSFAEQGAKEIGVRQMIDNGHLLLGFITDDGVRAALETFVIDAKALDKNRATVRAMVGPAAPPR